MTTRLTAAIAAATLAVGILVGASGAVVIRDATAPTFSDHMREMTAMQQMMGGQGMSGMMGGSMMGGSMMGPTTTMPGGHAQHHIQPDATQP